MHMHNLDIFLDLGIGHVCNLGLAIKEPHSQLRVHRRPQHPPLIRTRQKDFQGKHGKRAIVVKRSLPLREQLIERHPIRIPFCYFSSRLNSRPNKWFSTDNNRGFWSL